MGLESPWGMAKLVFFHDSANPDAADMPGSAAELLTWAQKTSGTVFLSAATGFRRLVFLKQLLIETVSDRAVLHKPVDEANLGAVTAPLFAYLDTSTRFFGAAAKRLRRTIRP